MNELEKYLIEKPKIISMDGGLYVYGRPEEEVSLHGGDTLKYLGDGYITQGVMLQCFLFFNIVNVVKKYEHPLLLDVGCAGADLARILYRNRVPNSYIGVEIHPDRAKEAGAFATKLLESKNYKALIIQKDAADGIPIQNGVINVAFCLFTLEHVSRERGIHMLSEMYRVMAPDSYLYLSTPIRWDESQAITDYHIFEWRIEDIIKTFEEVGFRVLWKHGLRASDALVDSLFDEQLKNTYNYLKKVHHPAVVNACLAPLLSISDDMMFTLWKG